MPRVVTHLLPVPSRVSDIGFEEEIMTFKRISQALYKACEYL